jgi:hypothetical protein
VGCGVVRSFLFSKRNVVRRVIPLSLCTIKATINYWLHLLSANANSLIYHSYQENTLRKDGLCSKIKLLLAEIGFTHVWVFFNFL